MEKLFFLFLLVIVISNCDANKFLLITESTQSNLNGKFVEYFGAIQKNTGIFIDAETTIPFVRKLSEDVYTSKLFGSKF